MFVSQSYIVRVQDPATGNSVEIIARDEALVKRTLKSIVKDIRAWQGTRGGKKWPRWQQFANTPIHTLVFEVIQKFSVV